MNQPVSDELISAYLDGELTPEETAEMERQLKDSVELREKLEELSHISHSMQSLTTIEAPADFRSSILSQLNDKPLVKPDPPPKYSFAWWRPIVAVCLLIGLGSILLSRNNDELSDPVAQYETAETALSAESADNVVDNALKKSGAALDLEAGAMESPAAGSLHSPALIPAEPSMRIEASPTQLEIEATPTETAVAAIVVPEEVPVTEQLLEAKLIELRRRPEYGEVISIIDKSQQTPVIVEFSVVDVMDSVDKINVLLKNNTAARSLMRTHGEQSESPQFTAIVLEWDNSIEMVSTLNQVPALGAQIFLPREPSESGEMIAGSNAQTIPPPAMPERLSGYDTPRPFTFELGSVQNFPEHKVQNSTHSIDAPNEKGDPNIGAPVPNALGTLPSEPKKTIHSVIILRSSKDPANKE